jgi:zinc/manganese transport system substrate-binding protein
MKKIFLSLCALLTFSQMAGAKIMVGASLPDLASIASSIGGSRVETFSVARSTSDPHSVEVLPSYMVRVSRADVYLKVGLGLDQWADQIVDGSRNARLQIVDCSRGISILEKPMGKVDASMGDIHPGGNPHYWLDPSNGIVIARNIAEALTAADPAGAADYKTNFERFKGQVELRLPDWKTAAAALPNRLFVSYHSSWAYFADAFSLEIAAKIEPVPGIPSTGSHLASLVQIIRERNIKLVIQEPYFADEGAKYLARETGVKVLTIAPSCSAASANSYLDHFQQIFDQLKTVN